MHRKSFTEGRKERKDPARFLQKITKKTKTLIPACSNPSLSSFASVNNFKKIVKKNVLTPVGALL
jgi:hypothetical protein